MRLDNAASSYILRAIDHAQQPIATATVATKRQADTAMEKLMSIASWSRTALIALFCTAALPTPWSASAAKPQTLHPILQAENSQHPNAPILQEWSRHKDATKRARVALAYGRIHHPDSAPALLVLLGDTSASVRATAAFALGHLGWRKAWTGRLRKHIINGLEAKLRDPIANVQKRAIEALAIYAPPRLEGLLLPILQRGSASMQYEALRALFRSKVRIHSRYRKQKRHHITPATLGTLRALAKHKNPLVRQQIAYYFARIKDPRGIDILLQLARDKSLWPRYFALFALRKLRHPKAIEVALLSTAHRSYIIRVAAIQAITSAKGAHKLPLTLAKDRSFHVRASLARAYGSLKQLSTAQETQLTQWLQRDPYITVRARALHTLAKQRAKQAPARTWQWLHTAMTSPAWVLREAAVGASRYLKAKQGTLLAMGHKDKDSRVRAAAILATGKQKGTNAFQLLTTALTSNRLAERGYAVMAMAKRKETNAHTLLWQTFQRSKASKWIELREEIVGTLSKGKSPQHTNWLQQAAKDNAPSVANKAIKALRARGIKALPTPTKPTLSHSPHRFLANAYMTPHKAPVIVLVTNRGKMEVTTTPHAAPIHVANLVGRVKAGLYNKLGWHRVISNFVIQGGDPDGSGWGDGGYQVRAEINGERYRRGTLGMPRAMGWHTGSVQLFFTHTPTPHLDGRYTVFGHVTKGLDIIDKIERGDQIIKAYIKPHKAASAPSTRPTSQPKKR